MPEFIKKHLSLYLAAALALATALLYLPSVNFNFITIDDGFYTVENNLVRGGLSWWAIKEAFTKLHLNYWIPVTLLSYMADSELFGMNPGAFHRTNVILHVLNVLFLFSFLYRATCSPWKSFFAALLWALHPMRVESVAWVTERKDLLSGAFFLLTLLAWGEYVRSKKAKWYLASLAAMFLGLASKPILVVTPVILLLIDFWPLERPAKGEELKKILVEKTPFFALAAAFSTLVIYAQRKVIYSTESVSFPDRLTDMSTSYLHYLGETLCPVSLVMVDRASATHLTGFPALGAGLLLLAATFFLWRARKAVTAAFAGWGWYLVTLFPVSGIVPVGLNFVADRFTYLPHMGIAVTVVWGADYLCGRSETARKAAIVLFALAAVSLAALSSAYLPKWKDPETLFSYFTEATGSTHSQLMLAKTYNNKRNYSKAVEILVAAIKKDPENHLLEYSRGFALSASGKKEEALEAFMRAYILNPEYVETHVAISSAAIALGRYDLARAHAEKALNINPESWSSMLNLGKVELKSGNLREALTLFERASKVSVGNYDLLGEAGLSLAVSGHPLEATGFFEKAVGLAPQNPDFNYNLARALLDSGQGEKAEKYFINSIRLDPGKPDAHFFLGNWLESAGRREEAAAQFRELLRINPGDGEAAKALARLEGAR